MSSFRFRLTPLQFQLLSALSQQPELKRRMIRATPVWDSQTQFHCEPYTLEVKTLIGSGMVGLVYHVASRDHQETFAFKKPRARFPFFQEIIRLELAVEQKLSHLDLDGFRPAKTLAHNALGLLKEYWSAPTLQNLLFTNQITPDQKRNFIKVLKQAAALWQEYQLGLDLSPKNLCWDAQSAQWILLDTGPKIHQSEAWQVFHSPDWQTYTQYIEKKLYQAGSEPSVLHSPTSADTLQTSRFAFIREWLFWLPCDPQADPDYFFVDLDSEAPSWEILYLFEQEENQLVSFAQGDPHWQNAALVQNQAIQSWEAQFGPCPFKPQLRKALSTQALLLHHSPIQSAYLSQLITPATGVLGRLLDSPPEPPPVPTLRIQPYAHWSELLQPGATPYAIYSQEPLLSSEEPLLALKSTQPHFELTLRDPSGHGFNQMIGFPQGNTRRAIVCLPGFRAAQPAVAPLIETLIEHQVEGLMTINYLGVYNPQQEMLLSTGRWEGLMLWQTLDYLLSHSQVEEIIVIAASYGAIAPLLIAPFCPAIRALILDSAIIHPLALLDKLGAAQGLDSATLRHHLRMHQLPDQDFSLSLSQLSHLSLLSLYPQNDKFAQICGQLFPEPDLIYQGGHAATMRHDSYEFGIPAACITAIIQFIQSLD